MVSLLAAEDEARTLTPPFVCHRVDCSGRRVASLDVDGVIKVWSFNPIMQTKASSISKSPLLSLEWATKRDRLVSDTLHAELALRSEFRGSLTEALDGSSLR